MRQKALIGLGAIAVLYFAGSAIAERNDLAGLWWQLYLPFPAYDLIEGPLGSLRMHAQYRAAQKFITIKSRTAATVRLCPFSDARFSAVSSDRSQMACWADMQNAYGAMIRTYFVAEFETSHPKLVDVIRWYDDEKTVWR